MYAGRDGGRYAHLPKALLEDAKYTQHYSRNRQQAAANYAQLHARRDTYHRLLDVYWQFTEHNLAKHLRERMALMTDAELACRQEMVRLLDAYAKRRLTHAPNPWDLRAGY